MCRRLVLLFLLVAVLGASAQAQFISAVERLNPDGNSGDTAVVVSPDPLAEDVVFFVDRDHQYNEIPEEVLGAQFVMTANDDKDNPNHVLNVTISQDCTLYVVIDNRISSGTGGLGVDPTLNAQMSWVDDLGFTDTGLDIGIDEGGDGDIDQYSSLFSASVSAGVISLGAQDNGGSRNMYGVLALGPKLVAYDPDPADGSEITVTNKALAWKAGTTAVSHDVYFSTDYDDVANGDPDASQGNRDDTWFLVGATGWPYPDGLMPGTTYYWRVDEVEAGGTKHQGPVWSFSIPFQIATEPDPVDGASFIDPDVTLTWEAGFKAAFHYVYFGDDYDTVANATGAPVTPKETYDPPGTLEAGKTYYWRVDEFDVTTTHTGEVWSFTTAPVIPIADPNLLAWYKFDLGEGTIAPDMSGHGRHATVNGATWIEDGQVGGAMEFTGDGDEVRYADGSFINGLTAITTTCWIKSDIVGTDKGFINYAEPAGNDRRGIRYDADGGEGDVNLFKYGMEYTSGNEEDESPANLQSTEWQHVAVTSASGEGLKFYLNGVLVLPEEDDVSESGTITGCTVVLIGKGGRVGGPASSWDGLVDDVRIYDKALTQEEIQQVMRGEPDLAWDPFPANAVEAQVAEAQTLSWSPGDFAVQHDVYFGTSKDAVKNADTGSPEYVGRRGGTTYSVASRVEFGGGPYYWRIDEVNNDATISKGRVWRFTIANYILIDDIETYDNQEFNRVWETWIDGWDDGGNGSQTGHLPTQDEIDNEGATFVEIDEVYGGKQSMPLYYENNMKYSEATMTLTGAKRDWTQYGVKTLSLWYFGGPASLGSFTEAPAGTYTITAGGRDIWGQEDEFHYAYKVLNGSGSITARIDSFERASNTWAKAGVMIRETLNADSVNAFTLVSYNGNRVRAQMRAETAGDTGGSGDVQDLTVAPHWIKLERTIGGEFVASHANDVAGSPDRWTVMTSAPVQMTTSVYIGLALTSHADGEQATAVFSHVSTAGNVTGAFMNKDIGIESNSPEPMYVSVEDAQGRTATVTNPDLNAANVTEWTEWGEYGQGIALTEFTAETPGLNLADVNSISLGFGVKGSPQPGGTGMVLFDDIKLYGGRCVPELASSPLDLNRNCVVDMPDLEILTDNWLLSDSEIATASPGAANALWKFENNLADSAGSSTGTAQGVVAYSAGVFGNALDLSAADSYITVMDNSAIEFGAGSFSISVWLRDDYVSGDPKEFLLCNGTNGSEFTDASGKRYVLKFEGGNFRFTIDDDVTKTIVNGNYADFATGDWVHAVAIRDVAAEQLRLYRNGVLEATTNGVGAGDIASPGEPLYIGAKLQEGAGAANMASAPVDHFFGGQMDELTLYGRALSDAEVAYLADTTPTDGSLYVPLNSAANVAPKVGDVGVYNPANPDVVNFLDYALLIDSWLDETLWP